MDSAHGAANVPMRWVGPIKVTGNVATTETKVPLATYESPLWPSVGRGAKISMLTVSPGVTAPTKGGKALE